MRSSMVLVSLLALTSYAASGQAGQAAPPYVEEVSGTAVTFEMVPIPGGSVRLDTPDGVRTVEVEPFWMSQTEVLWDLYDVFTFKLDKEAVLAGNAEAVSRPSKPYVLPGESFGHQGMPALAMTPHAAEQFAKWLSAKTGHTYRLPTEAEWEHACRLGRQDDEASLGEQAWYQDNAESQTHPPGDLAPNALGLYDMLGNVAEWAMAADGTPVVKGGSWRSAAEAVECGARQAQAPAWNVSDPQLPKSRWWLSDAPFVGLRLVRVP